MKRMNRAMLCCHISIASNATRLRDRGHSREESQERYQGGLKGSHSHGKGRVIIPCSRYVNRGRYEDDGHQIPAEYNNLAGDVTARMKTGVPFPDDAGC